MGGRTQRKKRPAEKTSGRGDLPLKIRIRVSGKNNRDRALSKTVNKRYSPPFHGQVVDSRSSLRKALSSILNMLILRDTYNLFQREIELDKVPDYLEVVSTPMCFDLMKSKVKRNLYPTLADFQHDFHLICMNCMKYNPDESIYYKEARRLLTMGETIIHASQKRFSEEYCNELIELDNSTLKQEIQELDEAASFEDDDNNSIDLNVNMKERNKESGSDEKNVVNKDHSDEFEQQQQPIKKFVKEYLGPERKFLSSKPGETFVFRSSTLPYRNFRPIPQHLLPPKNDEQDLEKVIEQSSVTSEKFIPYVTRNVLPSVEILKFPYVINSTNDVPVYYHPNSGLNLSSNSQAKISDHSNKKTKRKTDELCRDRDDLFIGSKLEKGGFYYRSIGNCFVQAADGLLQSGMSHEVSFLKIDFENDHPISESGLESRKDFIPKTVSQALNMLNSLKNHGLDVSFLENKEAAEKISDILCKELWKLKSKVFDKSVIDPKSLMDENTRICLDLAKAVKSGTFDLAYVEKVQKLAQNLQTLLIFHSSPADIVSKNEIDTAIEESGMI